MLRKILDKLLNRNKKERVEEPKPNHNIEAPELEYIRESYHPPNKKEDKKMKIDHNLQLSQNFKLGEYLVSTTARNNGLDNLPNEEHFKNIKSLNNNLIQPIRSKLGRAIVISSGYRSPEVNALVGGVPTSQHSLGQAADFVSPNYDNKKLAEFIIENFDFDQLILEFYNPKDGPNSGWIHLSYNSEGENRNEVISAIRKNGRTHYVQGLVENRE